MSGSVSLSGGCQCGAVRYRVEGTVVDAGVCHCRMCQKAGGNFGMAFFRAPTLVFTRGAPAVFQSSPDVVRGFCARCGTPLFMRGGDGAYDMTVGTLDHPDSVPTMKSQVGIESRCLWFATLSSVPVYPTQPDDEGGEAGPTRSFQHPDHDTAEWPPRN